MLKARWSKQEVAQQPRLPEYEELDPTWDVDVNDSSSGDDWNVGLHESSSDDEESVDE